MTMLHAGLHTTTGVAIPLRKVEVRGEVYGGHTQVTVRQRYHNTEPKPVEAVYTFPLPADASLVGFAMVCGDRRIEGVVKEREEAFRQYDEAIVAGHGAALLEQERPNVFTASVGNLLPGEETLIEVQYLQRLQADEGALRWMLPTLVAPRYIPGTPTGDRTADGWAEPTDRVPDADRITPRIGPVDYGLTLDLLFDPGSDITVESPSHQVRIAQEENKRVRVSFAGNEVALDRDVVLIARGITDGSLTTAVVHRSADAADQGEPGVLALTVAPDLASSSSQTPSQDVVFLIDISGSMMGASIGEAKAALRLCLRHLREGDRFNVIAFQSTYTMFARQLVPFTQRTLDQADTWVQTLVADGGTELLEPTLEAVKQVPDGVVVLLTDGQVGNEEEILTQVLTTRGRARVYTFGIGTNVSDTLLRDLARRTGGAVEFIHPGERIDEKVVAQFARAVAPRVTDVTLSFSGGDLEVSEQAPSELPDLVDGEPWEIFAHISGRGSGCAEIRGKYENQPFFLTVPIDCAAATSRPLLIKLWAAERIRDFEATALHGRRAERMKERIVELAVKYGLASRYTSFLVIAQRTGTRRAIGQPETRVIPVSLPAGWAMFEHGQPQPLLGVVQTSAMVSASAPMLVAKLTQRSGKIGQRYFKPHALRRRVAERFSKDGAETMMELALEAQAEAEPKDPLVALLSQQLASGLWDESGAGGSEDIRRVHATARALLALLRAGVTTAHPLHGAQVKKAVEALVKLAARIAAHDTQAAELALGVAWLVASGRRLRGKIEVVVTRNGLLAALTPRFGDEQAVRAYVEQLAM
jgi:Ca-activated chloride channel family protein